MLNRLNTWSWTLAITVVVLAVAYAYHEFTAATYFQTDDYFWRLSARIEPNPWRAFCDDLAAGQAFRPIRYLSWYSLEMLIPHIPSVVPIGVLAALLLYGGCAGLLAWQMSRDRWVGLFTAALSLLCPLLSRSALTWYSVLEDLMPPALMLLASSLVIVGRRTNRLWWLVPALLATVIAGLWKEIAYLMPALACALLMTEPIVQAKSEGRSPKLKSFNKPHGAFFSIASIRSSRSIQILLSQWYWWVPFVGIVAILLGWRFTVIGGSGLIGHHGLLSVTIDSRLEQFLAVAGLAGSTPAGLFYTPAVARSFPISMKATSAAWTLTEQLMCLLVIAVAWLLWLWLARDGKVLIAASLWYAISWLPALTLTVIQPSYLYLPVYAVHLLFALLLRTVARQPIIMAAVTVVLAWWSSIVIASHFRNSLPVAREIQRETDSLLEMVRQESEHFPAGTRIVLLGSRVMRPDIIAELDTAYRDERCKFDLYNFAAAPVELIAPAVPLDTETLGPLKISTEGLRKGFISMGGREFYFVDLTGSVQQLAEPRWNNRFWTHTPSGWRYVTN